MTIPAKHSKPFCKLVGITPAISQLSPQAVSRNLRDPVASTSISRQRQVETIIEVQSVGGTSIIEVWVRRFNVGQVPHCSIFTLFGTILFIAQPV